MALEYIIHSLWYTSVHLKLVFVERDKHSIFFLSWRLSVLFCCLRHIHRQVIKSDSLLGGNSLEGTISMYSWSLWAECFFSAPSANILRDLDFLCTEWRPAHLCFRSGLGGFYMYIGVSGVNCILYIREKLPPPLG